MAKVKVIQKKSLIGLTKRQIMTLKGLGLGKIGKARELNLTPEVQGMLDKVSFCIWFEII